MIQRLVTFTCLLLLASMAFATTVPCNSGIGNVATDARVQGGNNCSVGPSGPVVLLYSNFTVSVIGTGFPGTVGIATDSSTGVVGSEVDLGIQMGPFMGLTSADILLTYLVTGNTVGGDIIFQATPQTTGGTMTIIERICAGVPTSTASCAGAGNGGNPIFTGQWTSSGNTINVMFPYSVPGVFNQITVQKDISFNYATTSEFVNSNTVPEPATMLLIGGALAVLGVVKRRKKA